MVWQDAETIHPGQERVGGGAMVLATGGWSLTADRKLKLKLGVKFIAMVIFLPLWYSSKWSTSNKKATSPQWKSRPKRMNSDALIEFLQKARLLRTQIGLLDVNTKTPYSTSSKRINNHTTECLFIYSLFWVVIQLAKNLLPYHLSHTIILLQASATPPPSRLPKRESTWNWSFWSPLGDNFDDKLVVSFQGCYFFYFDHKSDHQMKPTEFCWHTFFDANGSAKWIFSTSHRVVLQVTKHNGKEATGKQMCSKWNGQTTHFRNT